LRFGMLSAIDLNDKLSLIPDKVRDIGSDRGLSPEVHSEWLERSDNPPHLSFGVGWIAPH